MRQPQRQKASYAFTLAELLIALAILGVIATFAIPKVLQVQQDSTYNATAKEAAAAVSSAYQLYLKDRGANPNMKSTDLTPYLNYVKRKTGCSIDADYGGTTLGPSSCYILHNGAALYFWSNMYFDGSNTTNGIFFCVDPDGQVTDGTTNGPGKSVYFTLYYNNRITTSGDHLPSTWNSYSQTHGAYDPAPSTVPPWFSWN